MNQKNLCFALWCFLLFRFAFAQTATHRHASLRLGPDPQTCQAHLIGALDPRAVAWSSTKLRRVLSPVLGYIFQQLFFPFCVCVCFSKGAWFCFLGFKEFLDPWVMFYKVCPDFCATMSLSRLRLSHQKVVRKKKMSRHVKTFFSQHHILLISLWCEA